MIDSQPLSSPVCLNPFILQPEERIRQLKDFLRTDSGQAQRVNVEALIKMYESGELAPRQLGDHPVYLVDGKRVDKDPWKDESVPPGTMKWCEVCASSSTERISQTYVTYIWDSFRTCITS